MKLRNCCEWSDFRESVERYWPAGIGDVDWKLARTAWGKFSATPAEFIRSCQREHRERLQLAKCKPFSESGGST